MPQHNRVLAVIPARSGSKRLPGKNIRCLSGVPLIAWTIRTAKAAGVFEDVLVSTDDHEIGEIAKEYGATVPWLRPSELSTDTATSVDVVLHALSELKESEGMSVMLLQPTSPFRSPETICRAVALHAQTDNAPVVSVCPAKAHPAWCFQVDDKGAMRRYAGDGTPLARSQDLPPVYQLNGSIYLATKKDLYSEHSFLCPHTRALIVTQPEESIDIDDAWDWKLAECIAAGLASNGEAVWHRA